MCADLPSASERVFLSLFPGIDLLGAAFQEVFPEVCIVRGPDLIFGSLSDIRSFHAPPGVFDGVIGGPPCQAFSALVHLVRANGHEPRFGNLFPEFERVVEEAQPRWYLTENVPAAPIPQPRGYWPARVLLLNNRWLGAEQNRVRRFCFGMRQDLEPRSLDVSPDLVALELPIEFQAVISGNGFDSGSEYYARADHAVVSSPTPSQRIPDALYARVGQAVLESDRNVPVKMGPNHKIKRTYVRGDRTVTANVGGNPSARAENREYRIAAGDRTSSDGSQGVKMVRYSIAEAARLQGWPDLTLDDCPMTKEGKLKALANGVPRAMGLAVAGAIRRLLDTTLSGSPAATSGSATE